MKVFLSWSGDTSREIATTFRDWLPYVIQAAKPFISSADIDKGKSWSEALASELSETTYGIIFITQENYRMPWIHFEAGAISKAVNAQSYVSPFLFNVDSIDGPLSQFQLTKNNQDDIFSLLKSINNSLNPEQKLSEEFLRRVFDHWWPELKSKLDKIILKPGNETGFEWLYKVDGLARIQAEPTCKCVWFITPDLYRNALRSLEKAVETNMNREVTYTFIIPSSDHMREAREGLRRMAAEKPGTIRIYSETPWEQFRKSAVTDCLIIDSDSSKPQVFLELPTTATGYWIKVEDEAAMGLVLRYEADAHKAR